MGCRHLHVVGERTVLVVAVRAGDRGERAAAAACAVLRIDEGRRTCPREVVATHVGADDLATRLAVAERVDVLDPGRLTSWWSWLVDRAGSGASDRPSAALALTAPGRGGDRLSAVRRLRRHSGPVRWITRRAQLSRGA